MARRPTQAPSHQSRISGMSTQTPFHVDEIDYPTGDGQPVTETPIHRDNLFETIWTLERWYEKQGREDVYVSGNMFVYYEKGNRRRHLSPDVFVVNGVPNKLRDCYKTWEEPKQTLDLVIEFTSRTTREEDLEDKYELYRDELSAREYLLFDPYAEYLQPPQQLFRLTGRGYEPVAPVDGRLASEVLGLHFGRDDVRLRLWVPETESWLQLSTEVANQYEFVQHENEELRQENQGLRKGYEELRLEMTQLRSELEALKRNISGTDPNGGESPQ
jgi:Uma2 family endonuclease